MSSIVTSDLRPRVEWEISDAENASDLKNIDVELDLHVPPEPVETTSPGIRRSEQLGVGLVTVFEKDRYNYRVTVQRLLWVDGKYRDPRDSTKVNDATLIVLKFQFSSHGGFRMEPLGYVYAQLDFGVAGTDGVSTDAGPEVVAWAPFNRTERVNKTDAQMSKGTDISAGIQAGYAGASGSANYSKTQGVSWPRTYFEEYTSAAVVRGSKPVGVYWELQQNALQNHGVLPFFLATVLVTRPSNEPYLAKFTMRFMGGRLKKTLQKFGLSKLITDKSTYRCTPGPEEEVCVLEGKDIKKKVDLSDLAKLVNAERSTELCIPHNLDFDGGGLRKPSVGAATAAEDAVENTANASAAAAYTDLDASTGPITAPEDQLPPQSDASSSPRRPTSQITASEDRLPPQSDVSQLELKESIIVELENTLRDVREDLRGVREDLRGVRNDLQFVRQDRDEARQDRDEARRGRDEARRELYYAKKELELKKLAVRQALSEIIQE